jgi:hypothetical protein
MSSGWQPPAGEPPPRRPSWSPAPYRRRAHLLDQLADVEPDEEITPEQRATAIGLLIALVVGLAAATALVIFAIVAAIR